MLWIPVAGVPLLGRIRRWRAGGRLATFAADTTQAVSVHSSDLHRSLSSLYRELVSGPGGGGAFVLNKGDPGLLRSLARLSSSEASRSSLGGATIAAHVEHLRYGLSLMNRWAAGENPFGDADWSKSWETTVVTDPQWTELRHQLQGELERWDEALASAREVSGIEIDGVLASVIHLAYHVGAIRQIATEPRGPKAAS